MKVYILTCESSYCDIESNEILGVYDSEDKAKQSKSEFIDLYTSNPDDFDYFIIEIKEQEVQ